MEATNRRLKSIILGYRPEERKKKQSFFSSFEEPAMKGELPANIENLLEVSPRICVRTEAADKTADS